MSCQCLTLKNTQCKFNAKKGDIYCGKHTECKKPIFSVLSSESLKNLQSQNNIKQKEKKQSNNQKLKKISTQKYQNGPKGKNEKLRMLNECGEYCCADKTDDGLCHYAMCKEGTCDQDCSVIYGTSVYARMNTNRAANFKTNPRSKDQMMKIREKVSDVFDKNKCSRKKETNTNP